MFNFIFDGKLGNIIAPVGNTSKLFLAIQHHKNVEFFDLISQQGYELNALLEGGQAAIHVACRYDNRVAVEAIISRSK